MTDDAAATPRPGRGEQAAHISREMVRLMRRTAGRGPTKARTSIGRDHVLVMFQESLTDGERNLIENGYRDEVEAVRESYQKLIRDEAIKLIEESLYRRVVGFMSTNHFEPDMAAEVFVLEPDGGADTETHHEVREG